MSPQSSARTFLASARFGDKFLAVAAGLISALYCYFAYSHPAPLELAQAFLSLLFIPLVLVWRSRPIFSSTGFLLLLAAWAAAWMSQLPANSGATPWALTAPMAVYTTSRYVPRRAIPRIVLAITAIGTFVSPFMWRIDTETYLLHYAVDKRYLAMLVAHWAVLGCTYFIAARYFDQDRQREILTRERFHQAQEEERLLIARELHDVLAHSLTLIKVQSNAGIIAARRDTHAAEETLHLIREGADSALTEVRSIVTTLRSSGPSDLEPAKQLEHVEGIIDGFRNAGLAIDAQLPSEYSVPSLVQLALVRIMSEGLTNVLRHQGEGTHVTIELTLGSMCVLTLSSTNPQPAPNKVSGSSAGLVGLAERARALNGTLEYSGDAYSFTLHAEIPNEEGTHAPQRF